MNRLLKRGDVFTSGKLAKVGYRIKWLDDGTPKLHTDELTTHVSTVLYHKRETQPGGWSREVEQTVNNEAPDHSATRFTVVATAMGGGGTGHGEQDVHPDGHKVMCESDGLYLEFYQTGCFIDIIPPEDVMLISVKP